MRHLLKCAGFRISTKSAAQPRFSCLVLQTTRRSSSGSDPDSVSDSAHNSAKEPQTSIDAQPNETKPETDAQKLWFRLGQKHRFKIPVENLSMSLGDLYPSIAAHMQEADRDDVRIYPSTNHSELQIPATTKLSELVSNYGGSGSSRSDSLSVGSMSAWRPRWEALNASLVKSAEYQRSIGFQSYANQNKSVKTDSSKTETESDFIVHKSPLDIDWVSVKHVYEPMPPIKIVNGVVNREPVTIMRGKFDQLLNEYGPPRGASEVSMPLYLEKTLIAFAALLSPHAIVRPWQSIRSDKIRSIGAFDFVVCGSEERHKHLVNVHNAGSSQPIKPMNPQKSASKKTDEDDPVSIYDNVTVFVFRARHQDLFQAATAALVSSDVAAEAYGLKSVYTIVTNLSEWFLFKIEDSRIYQHHQFWEFSNGGMPIRPSLIPFFSALTQFVKPALKR